MFRQGAEPFVYKHYLSSPSRHPVPPRSPYRTSPRSPGTRRASPRPSSSSSTRSRSRSRTSSRSRSRSRSLSRSHPIRLEFARPEEKLYDYVTQGSFGFICSREGRAYKFCGIGNDRLALQKVGKRITVPSISRHQFQEEYNNQQELYNKSVQIFKRSLCAQPFSVTFFHATDIQNVRVQLPDGKYHFTPFHDYLDSDDMIGILEMEYLRLTRTTDEDMCRTALAESMICDLQHADPSLSNVMTSDGRPKLLDCEGMRHWKTDGTLEGFTFENIVLPPYKDLPHAELDLLPEDELIQTHDVEKAKHSLLFVLVVYNRRLCSRFFNTDRLPVTTPYRWILNKDDPWHEFRR